MVNAWNVSSKSSSSSSVLLHMTLTIIIQPVHNSSKKPFCSSCFLSFSCYFFVLCSRIHQSILSQSVWGCCFYFSLSLCYASSLVLDLYNTQKPRTFFLTSNLLCVYIVVDHMSLTFCFIHTRMLVPALIPLSCMILYITMFFMIEYSCAFHIHW